MNFLFCTRALTADFPFDFSLTCISLNVKFSIPTKNLESFSNFLAFFDQSSCMKSKNVGSFGQVTSYSQNCVTGLVERNLSQSQILNGNQEKNSAVPKYFLDGFQR